MIYTLYKDLDLSSKVTLVNVLAEGCEHCKKLKEIIPEIEKIASQYGFKVYNIEASEDSKEAFEKYQIESIPYTLVFDSGVFVGADNFDAQKYIELINILAVKHGKII